MKIIELQNYIQDSASLFDLVASEPWAQYLDSGVSFNPFYGPSKDNLDQRGDFPHSKKSCGEPNTGKGITASQSEGVDILVCRPQSVLLTDIKETKHYGVSFDTHSLSKDKSANFKYDLLGSSKQSPFVFLKQVINETLASFDFCLSEKASSQFKEVPFWAGAVGYFGYELSRQLETLPENSEDDVGIPEMAIGIYETAIVVCHEKKRSWLIDISGRNEALQQFWLDKINEARSLESNLLNIEQSWRALSDKSMSYSREQYSKKFKKIKHYLKEGDCYQVNLTNRFSVPVTGSSWQSYLKMRALSHAPFGAYMNFPFAQVLSNSPERFIECFHGQVQTSPIKGTRPRNHDDEVKDLALAAELESSIKDRAENVMIVDLLRNDLGRICETGSVNVTQLFGVESYANVHHLVSHISSKLPGNMHALDLLESCFPGGSITGAPKKRAMEIIDELEPHCRGVYCGAIGWIDFLGNMQTNIAIRTITHLKGHCYFSAGGGIVVDSDEDSEFQELLDKASIMYKTVGCQIS